MRQTAAPTSRRIGRRFGAVCARLRLPLPLEVRFPDVACRFPLDELRVVVFFFCVVAIIMIFPSGVSPGYGPGCHINLKHQFILYYHIQFKITTPSFLSSPPFFRIFLAWGDSLCYNSP